MTNKKSPAKFLIAVSAILIYSTLLFGREDNRDGLPLNLTSEQNTKLKTPLLNFFKNTDFSLFTKEFEISFTKTVECGKGLDWAIGLKAHLIEPIGYIETTPRPFHFPFADFDININGDSKVTRILKSGQVKSQRDDDLSGRESLVYSHFIYFPILGMVTKRSASSFMCFHSGSVSIPYISELFPFYKKSAFFNTIMPQMTMMMTPQGILSMILDCTATIASSKIRKYTADKSSAIGSLADFDENSILSDAAKGDQPSEKSLSKKALEKLDYIRNTMIWSAGCLGPRPIGGYVDGTDTLTDSDLMAYGVLNILHGASAVMKVPFLQKQTNFGMGMSEGSNVAIKDTMCRPQDFPILPPSQYLLQRVYPTVGEAHEMGEPGATHAVAGNVPGAAGETVSIVWMRRDYAAGAYFCPSAKGSPEEK